MIQTSYASKAIAINKVINSDISAISFQDAIDHIFYLATNQSSSYVCFANVHMIIEAFSDSPFQKVLNKADLALPDGLPLTKYISLFESITQERVAGPDTMPVIMKRAEKEGKSVFFYGGSNLTLHLIEQKAQREFPNLKIAGTYSPPFRELNVEEDEEIVQQINAANPDFVFVCLGCPKQEKWMYAHKGKINSCMLGVGQAFSIYADIYERAPKWVQQNYLEWAYRLYKEPKRLAKRYLYTNTVFLYLVSRLYFRKMRKKELLPI